MDERSSKAAGGGSRLCPRCSAPELVKDGQRVWPPDWSCSACGGKIETAAGVPVFAPDLANTVSGFDPRSFEFLAAIEDDHFWFVPRNRLLTSLFVRYFPSAVRVLEIGCGTGTVLQALAHANPGAMLVGSELHPAGLSIARGRVGTDVELVQMDARDIKALGLFDVVGAFDVLEHIPEDEAVLRSMHRALVPGGGVVISVPQHPEIWSTADDVAHHVRRYRRKELEEKLRRNGFRVLFSTSYCASLLPLMIGSRWLERLRSSARKGVAASTLEVESRPPRAINRFLTSILQLEVTAILSGARLPVGGSRVVVARKA